MVRRRKVVLIAGIVTLGAIGTLAYAVLPTTSVDPSNVPLGTLVGQSPVDVQSIGAFVRAINPERGTNAVLQHVRLAPGQSTGWHTHPGPNIVMFEAGSATLTDEHCRVMNFGTGQSFATGLDVHQLVAGPDGADTYTFYLLPGNATVTRTDANPPDCNEK
jgi:quercetin dioxygenase-like cupin family protein